MRNAIIAPDAPPPIGPFSHAVVEGHLVFVSGQGPVHPQTGQVEREDVRAATAQTLKNLGAVLQAAGSSLSQVLRVNVYLADLRDFAAMNEVYATFFAAPYPARTTIQAAALPGGIPVEIDCVARR